MKFQTSENRDQWVQTDYYQIFVERTLYDGYYFKIRTLSPDLLIINQKIDELFNHNSGSDSDAPVIPG